MALLCRHIEELIGKFKLPQQKKIVTAVLICTICALSAYQYGKFILAEDINKDAEEIAEYCESLECDHVYVYFSQELSELTRFFSGGKDYTRMLANGRTYIRDYYLAYQDRPIDPTEKTLFVFSVEDGAALGLTQEDGGIFNGYELNALNRIGDYVVYSVK